MNAAVNADANDEKIEKKRVVRFVFAPRGEGEDLCAFPLLDCWRKEEVYGHGEVEAD